MECPTHTMSNVFQMASLMFLSTHRFQPDLSVAKLYHTQVILELWKGQVCKGFAIDEILLEGLNIPASQQRKQFRVLSSSVDKILSMTQLDHFMVSPLRFEESSNFLLATAVLGSHKVQ